MPQIPNILSVLTFLPLVGAVLIMFMKRPQDLPDDHGGHGHDGHDEETPAPKSDPARNAVNAVALLTALVTLVLSLLLFLGFDAGFAGTGAGIAKHIQHVEDYRWITVGATQIHYKMGIDGISLLLILLTTFLMIL